MVKMNNKGFAISTVIYGLSIMGVLIISILMGIMSTSRSNTKKISKSIEDELTRFSKTDTSFAASTSNTPTAQEYVVPTGQSGWYLIELWGAQGGSSGGYGAYTSGVIHLQEGEVLYFYVGKKRPGSNSGLSTDVRLLNGNYDNNDNASKRSYETRIMVAAGGGMNAGADGGTLYGYNSSMRSLGGKIRVSATTGAAADYNLISGTLAGYPASYAKSNVTQTSAQPKPHQNGSTGGDGYVSSASAAIGGTSFISGYAGANAYVRGVSTGNPKYTYYEYIYNDAGDGTYDTEDGREYYFVDGKMIAGVNAGDGRAKISRIQEETDIVKTLEKKNKKMINVRYIRDCLSASNDAANIVWNKLEAIREGNNIAKGKALTATTKTGYTCRQVDLGANYDLDEIAVWHKDGIDYKNHTIEVSENNSTWKWLKAPGSGTEYSETENVTGARISAYQADYTQKLPNSGDYYIFPVLSENKVFTAHATAETESDPISVAFINGQKRQSWSIELIDESLREARGTTDEYKIIELARYKSLEIYLDENIVGNQVKANTRFNSYGTAAGSKGHDPEIWKINPIGNGTYQIVTVVPIFNPANPSGNLCAQTNPDISANYNKVLIGRTNITTARFKFVSISY